MTSMLSPQVSEESLSAASTRSDPRSDPTPCTRERTSYASSGTRSAYDLGRLHRLGGADAADRRGDPADRADRQRAKVPLWTHGTGMNNGYGGPAPRVKGSVIVSLRRMNRVLEINEDSAYAVVEPGVRWFDLYDALARAATGSCSRSPTSAGAASSATPSRTARRTSRPGRHGGRLRHGGRACRAAR